MTTAELNGIVSHLQVVMIHASFIAVELRKLGPAFDPLFREACAIHDKAFVLYQTLKKIPVKPS